MYQPGSSPSDVDVVGASCVETLPPMAPPMEETGVEMQGLPPLCVELPCPCTGEGASYEEVSSGPRFKVWHQRAASGSSSGNHRSRLLIRPRESSDGE